MEFTPALCAIETISASLRTILHGVMAALGAWRVETARALLLHRRISGTLGQIERLLLRFRSGRLWRVAQRDVVQRRSARTRSRGPALPRRFGWLVQMGGHPAACFGLQLQTVLNTSEMAELLQTSPQAARILRPLCRALAVALPGVAARAGTQTGARKRRASKPRVRPEPFKIPLPRGVLTAARRQGFGKLC